MLASAVLTWYLQPCVVVNTSTIQIESGLNEHCSRSEKKEPAEVAAAIVRTRNAVAQAERGDKLTAYFPGDATSTQTFQRSY